MPTVKKKVLPLAGNKLRSTHFPRRARRDMQLNQYTLGTYSTGANFWKQVLWYYGGAPLVRSYLLTNSSFKCWILRCFGARVGEGVRIKPGVRVKFPWRLVVGDFVWLGENCWIDNLAMVTIGSNSCISQDVYICTGNHDWSDPAFGLKDAPVHVGQGCWLAARATIGPGVTVGEGAVLGLGSVASRSLAPMTIYGGNPAEPVRARKVL
jgi:putative colanic acid biosynthesis acetyltransferase WcaF